MQCTPCQEILQYPEIFSVPGSPEYVLGIINLRGEVITIADIRIVLIDTPDKQ